MHAQKCCFYTCQQTGFLQQKFIQYWIIFSFAFFIALNAITILFCVFFVTAALLTAAGRSYGSGAASTSASSAYTSSFTTALTQNSDAIVYPDDIVRDSYGNIARPYVPLTDTANTLTHQKLQQAPAATAAGVGFHTDINKDKTHHETIAVAGGSAASGSTSTIGSVSYPLPSYAGGILSAGVSPPQLDLLPPAPLSSGNYNYPTVVGSGDSVSKPSGSTLYAQSSATFDQPATSINEVATGPSKYPAKNPDVYVAKPSAVIHDSGSSYAQAVPQAAVVSPANSDSTYTHGKFTGSFGGASGFLGEQKIGGTAYTSTTAAPVTKTSSASSYNPQPSSSSHVAPSNIQPPPLPSVGQQDYYASKPSEAPASSGSSYNQPQQYPAQSQAAPSNLKPPPLSSDADKTNYYAKPIAGSSYASGATATTSVVQHQYGGVASPAPSATNTNYGLQHPSTPQHVPGVLSVPIFSLADILGEQKQPGYGVTVDGAGSSSAHNNYGVAAAVPVQQPTTVHQQAATGGGGKYTGGFGGPPGVLSPYDKSASNAVQTAHPANSHATTYAGPNKRY